MAGENDTIGIYQELLNRNAVPSEHRATVDELVRRGVLKSAGGPVPEGVTPEQGKEIQTRTADFQPSWTGRALRTGTLGTLDEVMAGAETPMRVVRNLVNQKPMNWGEEYDQALRVQRAQRDKERQYYDGTATGIASDVAGGLLMAPAAGVGAAANAAGNAMPTFLQTLKSMQLPLAVAGAKWGGASAYGEADGSSNPEAGILDHAAERARAVPAGAARGAAGALLFGNTIAGAMKGRDVWRERGTTRALENQQRRDELRSVGIENPLPAAVSGSPLAGPATRASGALIGGNPINAKAAEDIGTLQNNLNRMLSRPIDGQEAGDLGRNIQGDLRNALTRPSRSADELAGMGRSELEGITGPVSTEGFLPAKPRVDQFKPRNVDPVQPRDVGPEPQPPSASESARSLGEQLAERERSIKAAVAEHNKLAEASKGVTERYKPVFDKHSELGKQEQALREKLDSMNGAYIKMRQEGETVPAYQARMAQLSREHAAIVDQMNRMQPDLRVAQKALDQYGNADMRVTKIRRMHEDRDRTQAAYDRFSAQEEAQRVHFAKQQEDYHAARTKAAAEAADETARLQEMARREAADSTTAAQRAADERYQQQIKDGGFRVGSSRESYPTELSAAYKIAEQDAPKGVKVFPLGDGYTPSKTLKTLESIASEGKKSLAIKDFDGRVFDENGDISAPLVRFLRNRIGNDMTGRLEALAALRTRGPIPQPGIEGIRSFLSDLRTLAREAAKSRYSPTPRTEDAAMLQRLATALQDDLYRTLDKTGQSPGFRTADAEYKVSPRGNVSRGDSMPSDMTYYVTPDHFEKLTKGTSKPNTTISIPATQSLKAERNQIGYYQNNPTRPNAGEFDRSGMVPFSTKPEPGLVPIQVWSEGGKVHYGSPIISRETSSGERSRAMFQNVDQQYAAYINELRKPLSKIYGDKVDGVQAMDRLVKAAKDGETGILNAFMRVMNEKSDPTKGAAAIIYHMTGGGRDMTAFNKAWKEMKPVTRNAIFNNGPAKELERDISRYVAVADRYEKFVKAAQQSMAFNPSRFTHLLTISGIFTHMPLVVGSIAGNAVASRVLASPKLLRWMTQVPNAARGGFETPAFRTHVGRLGAIASSTDKDKAAAKAMKTAVAEIIASPAQAADRKDHSYDPEADTEMQGRALDDEERPFPVPQSYTPPAAFQDKIYVSPKDGPARRENFDGITQEDRDYYWEREVKQPMRRGYR